MTNPTTPQTAEQKCPICGMELIYHGPVCTAGGNVSTPQTAEQINAPQTGYFSDNVTTDETARLTAENAKLKEELSLLRAEREAGREEYRLLHEQLEVIKAKFQRCAQGHVYRADSHEFPCPWCEVAKLHNKLEAAQKACAEKDEALNHCLEVSSDPEKFGRYLTKKDRYIIKDALALSRNNDYEQ